MRKESRVCTSCWIRIREDSRDFWGLSMVCVKWRCGGRFEMSLVLGVACEDVKSRKVKL